MNYDYGLACVACNAFVYVITFLVAFRRTNSLVSFIVFLYAISSTLGIVLFCYNTEEWNITLGPYIYFYVIFLIMIWPLTKFNPYNLNVRENDIPNTFVWIGLFIGSFSLIRSLLSFMGASYLGEDYELSEVYTLTRSEGASNATRGLTVGFGSMLTIFGNSIRLLSVFFLYYFLTLRNSLRNKMITELLFILIAYNVFLSLLMADRSQAVRYVFWFIVGFFIFRKYVQIPKYVKVQVLAGTVAVLILFGMITISRFETQVQKTENPIIYSLVDYSAQGFFHFNAHFFKNDFFSTHGDYTASLVRFLLGLDYSKASGELDIHHHLVEANVSGHVFNTYLGPFVLDYGKLVTFALMFCISCCLRFFIDWKNIRLDSLILLYLYAMVLSFGVITYQFSYFFGNLCLFSWIFVVVMFRICSKFERHR